MSWTESYHCDVCGKPKTAAGGDWWLGWLRPGEPGAESESMVKISAWNHVLAHTTEARHLCGAGCAHTLLDRWMSGEAD